MRVQREPGYLLHLRAYRESSAILEVLTRNHGRVALVGRGVRTRSGTRAGLLPFRALNLSWSGRGELHSLTAVEPEGPALLSGGQAHLCGLYANELIMRLVPRHNPSEVLYDGYAGALVELGAGGPVEASLRGFELTLLRASGYGLQLDCEATTGEALAYERLYGYDNERGAVYAGAAPRSGPVVSGRTLLALKEGELSDPRVLREAKALLRHVIDDQLQGKELITRHIMRYLIDTADGHTQHDRQ